MSLQTYYADAICIPLRVPDQLINCFFKLLLHSSSSTSVSVRQKGATVIIPGALKLFLVEVLKHIRKTDQQGTLLSHIHTADACVLLYAGCCQGNVLHAIYNSTEIKKDLLPDLSCPMTCKDLSLTSVPQHCLWRGVSKSLKLRYAINMTDANQNCTVC